MSFKKLFRKRGLYEILKVLGRVRGNTLRYRIFLKRLKAMNSYYNAYARVKDDALKYGLIEFGVNKNGKKTISLTKKGKKVYEILKEICMIFEIDSPDPDSVLKKKKRKRKK